MTVMRLVEFRVTGTRKTASAEAGAAKPKTSAAKPKTTVKRSRKVVKDDTGGEGGEKKE